MYVKRHDIAILTDALGAFTGYTSEEVRGEVLQYRYVPDGSTPLDIASHLDITGAITGVSAASKATLPSVALTESPAQRVFLDAEKIKVVVSAGGNAKSGTLYLWVG